MAKKKAPARKRFVAKKKALPKEIEQGFFQRLKDILPEQKKETVRVKTYIVEKPVYVQASMGRVSPPRQKYNLDDEPQEKFDSKRSKYSKKRFAEAESKKDLGTLEEELPAQEEELAEGKELLEGEGGFEEGQDEFGETSEDGLTDEEGGQEEQGDERKATHVRSRGMFTNAWWKRAVLWAILFWMVILVIEMSMWVSGLISDVSLTRRWWYLLGILVIISLVWHRIFLGRVKI